MSSVENDTPELAEYYDRVSDSQFEQGLILTGLMNIKAGEVVLDVGCGTGRLAFHVSGLVGPAGRVIGIDPSPHRIQVAADKLKTSAVGNVRFAVGQGEALDGFGDNTFDRLYYCSVFHWIGDKPAALNEAYRVLKPDGIVGITSRTGAHPSLRHAVVHEWIAQHPEAMKNVMPRASGIQARRVSREELETMLTNAGFVDIRCESRPRTHNFQSPEEYFAFLEASSFGQLSQLSRLPAPARQEVMHRITEALEKRRTPRGIELHSSSLIVIARKKV